MILTSPAIALSLEQAHARQLAQQAIHYGDLAPDNHGEVIYAAGASAAITEAAFGRKLNHVVGLGMGAVVTDQDLNGLVRAYANRGMATEIDLCPHADPSALASLGCAGFAVNAFSNTYVRALTDDDLVARFPDHIDVLTERTDTEPRFVAASVAGFGGQAQPKPIVLLKTLARIAMARADTTLFIAVVNGVAAGSAGLSILPSDLGPIAHLYIASTLPAYRSQGIQLALLRARLQAARRAGCVLASVTARPGNGSTRNVERAGFNLAYTTATFASR
jgi:GNAT superfamily N-acetyltransferase